MTVVRPSRVRAGKSVLMPTYILAALVVLVVAYLFYAVINPYKF